MSAFMPARQYTARQPADYTDPGADPCTDHADVNEELAVMFRDPAIRAAWFERTKFYGGIETAIYSRLTDSSDVTAVSDWREIAFDYFSDDSENRQEALRRVVSRSNDEAEE